MTERRERILRTLNDLVASLLYYDRKEDQNLPVGAIEEAIHAGEITLDEMLDCLREQMTGVIDHPSKT